MIILRNIHNSTILFDILVYIIKVSDRADTLIYMEDVRKIVGKSINFSA